MAENFVLQLLHHADFEGNTNALDDAPRLAALFDHFDDTYVGNTLKLSAGDNWIPSPWYNSQQADETALVSALQDAYETHFGLSDGTLSALTVSPGVIDQAILNLIGIEASTLGNHDFDQGDTGVARIIGMSVDSEATSIDASAITNIGTLFPYITTNLDFSESEALSGLVSSTAKPIQDLSVRFSGNEAIDSASEIEALLNQDRIAPGTTVEVDGELIGIVGATTQRLAAISSPGDVSVIGATDDDMALLAQQIQAQVDALFAANPGMNKMIVVSHLQDHQNEAALAKRLSGVDIILGGGSDAIFADQTDVLRPGQVASETYPLVHTGADGAPVLQINTDGQYQYLGRLVVEFDENGEVLTESINAQESGAYAATDAMVEQLYGSADPFAAGTAAALVKQLADAVDGIIGEKIANVAGFTDVYLNGARASVRNEETNLGNLTADANLAAVRDHIEQNLPELSSVPLVSLKNGGGIRADIGLALGTSGPEAPVGGAITQLDIETSLAFNNGLALVETDAAGLVTLLEHGLATAGETDGRFPQVGGLSLNYDIDRPAGSRLVSLQIDGTQGQADIPIMVNGALVVDPDMAINIATLDFLALNDGDGYAFSEVASKITALVQTDDKTFDTPLAEQNALFKFLQANHGSAATAFDQADVSSAQDTRLVNVNEPQGSDADDQLTGGQPGDTLSGSLGTDTVVLEGNQADYIVVRDHAKVTIAPADQPSQAITWINVERLTFADGSIELDYNTAHSQIATLYDKVLGRQADLDGFQFWATGNGNGYGIGDIAMDFFKSQEYVDLTGHSIDQATIEQNLQVIYQALLGRAADAQGMAYWQDAISKGAATLAGVAQTMLAPEVLQESTGSGPLMPAQWDFMV